MKPGFHYMPAAEYHADPAQKPSLSSSIAKILLRESPRKAWFSHPRLNKDFRMEHDDKFDLGTSAHALLLEDSTSKLVVVEANDWRTNKAKEERENARASGKVALLARHAEAVHVMVSAAKSFIENSEIAEAWGESESEVTGIWEERGTWFRCRFDRITKARDVIIDYKTTVNAAPEVFSRMIPSIGYHWQDAFYRRGAKAIGGFHDPLFVLLAQSIEPPHECSLHGCHPALKEIADADIERAALIWRTCLTRNEWPSYSGRVHWAMPTAYMMSEHEMRLQEAA